MKKLSVFILVLAMVFPICASEKSMRGDMNWDGNVNIADVTALISYLLSHEWPALPEGVHEYVDLGLSSGTLWATCNIGATNPEDYGDYFAWGETVPNKENFAWATTAYVYDENGFACFSKYNTNSQYGEVDNLTELDPEDDAAYVNWGPDWRMPTAVQIQELLNQCNWSDAYELNGVKGRLLTSKVNGNTLFLPFAGQRIGTNLSSEGSNGNYWARELFHANNDYQPHNAFMLYFDSSIKQRSLAMRFYGLSVRPVFVGQEVPTDDYELGDVNQDGNVNIADVTALISFLLSHAWPNPDPDDECVDLGLPTGTLWATHNVGANKPEELGDYFAWGETAPKANYAWNNTAWVHSENGQVIISKYNTKSQYGEVDNKTELDPEDDAAYVNMGSDWRMPSKAQVDELLENCTWEWTQLNGVNGQLITGPNGNTLFLPAGGDRIDTDIDDVGVLGNYWTRSLYVVNANVSFPTSAYKIYFNAENGLSWNAAQRNCGFPVRAVRVTEE